jgi:hypothetical protein
MSSNGTNGPACWFCGAAVPPALAEAESILRTRTADEGGPFLTLTCPKCRTRCGALRNRLGAWMLYPLEGATEPSLVDRVLPRTSREHQARARAWWLRNAGEVERFRAARRERPSRPAPRPRRRESAPRERPSSRGQTRIDSRTGARAVLGVADDATLRDVQHAWRAAVKRWHPDRIASRDPVVLAESTRRFAELRSAYEALVAELSR